MKRIQIGAVLLGLAFITGCGSTVAPSPTYLCVPEPGGDAVPCDATEFETAQRRDALYADAIAATGRGTGIRLTAEPTMSAEAEATTEGPYRLPPQSDYGA